MQVILYCALLFSVPAFAAPTLWDALLAFGPRPKVIARFDPVIQWGDAVFHGPEMDVASRDRLRDLREKLGTYDLELLVGERAACAAQGTGAHKEQYYFALPATPSCAALPGFSGDMRSALGAWTGQFKLTAAQQEKERNYQIQFSGGLTLGDFKFEEIAVFSENILKFFEAHAGEDPLAIWKVINAQSPRFAQFIDRFFVVGGVAVKQGDATAVDLQWMFRVNALQKGFPALYARLNKIGRVGDTQGVILNSQGQRLLKYRVRSYPRTVRLQFLVRAGRILPFDLEEKPIEGAVSLRLGDRTDLDLQVLQAVRFGASGVEIEVNNLRWNMELKRQGARQSVRMALQGYDRLDVNGSVWGFIPLAVVNAMIPKTIELSAKQSLDTSVGAFGVGKTTVMGMALDAPTSSAPARSSFEMQGALAENKFLQFMLRLTGTRFAPKDEELADLGQLMALYYSALRADYLRWVAGL